MKNSTVETLIGAAVVAVAAFFFIFAYQTSGKATASGAYRLSAEFDNASGINVGTDVRVAGVKVGSVVGFTLNPENFQARVMMEVDPRVKLTEDATAKVTSEGLLGASFISLEQGGAETMLADGGHHLQHAGRGRHLVADQPGDVRQEHLAAGDNHRARGAAAVMDGATAGRQQTWSAGSYDTRALRIRPRRRRHGSGWPPAVRRTNPRSRLRRWRADGRSQGRGDCCVASIRVRTSWPPRSRAVSTFASWMARS